MSDGGGDAGGDGDRTGGTGGPTAKDEVLGLARDLIRIDTTNTGDAGSSIVERPAAEWVAEKLTEVGLEPVYVESGARGRGNVIVRLAGADPTRGALLVHGHLDVVPADAAEWSVHPHSGEVKDGYLWGRGAVDMKDMVAMSLAVLRQFVRDGVTPPRDLVFAFLADEESGGFFGARWLVRNRPELFDGVTEAIGEVGGFSETFTTTDGDPVRAYLIETAEKGVTWMRLRARGTPGHASMLNSDNAVATLAAGVARLGRHSFPQTLTPALLDFFAGVTDLTGMTFPVDDLDAAVAKLGNLSRIVGATLRDTATVTTFHAGYKGNVVPSLAEATVDCRILPGRETAFYDEVAEILGPDIEREWDDLPPVQTTFDGALVDAMTSALIAEDPTSKVLPYMLSAGTDAKSFSELGIRCFGFAPLQLPADLDFSALFHGIDERVPVTALEFGCRVLEKVPPHLLSCGRRPDSRLSTGDTRPGAGPDVAAGFADRLRDGPDRLEAAEDGAAEADAQRRLQQRGHRDQGNEHPGHGGQTDQEEGQGGDRQHGPDSLGEALGRSGHQLRRCETRCDDPGGQLPEQRESRAGGHSQRETDGQQPEQPFHTVDQGHGGERDDQRRHRPRRVLVHRIGEGEQSRRHSVVNLSSGADVPSRLVARSVPVQPGRCAAPGCPPGRRPGPIRAAAGDWCLPVRRTTRAVWRCRRRVHR